MKVSFEGGGQGEELGFSLSLMEAVAASFCLKGMEGLRGP